MRRAISFAKYSRASVSCRSAALNPTDCMSTLSERNAVPFVCLACFQAVRIAVALFESIGTFAFNTTLGVGVSA